MDFIEIEFPDRSAKYVLKRDAVVMVSLISKHNNFPDQVVLKLAGEGDELIAFEGVDAKNFYEEIRLKLGLE